MSEYLHHTDKIFRSAYRQFRDEPTADLWKKINDTLDREATRSYKQRSMNLRRISFVLLLLLTVLILFETVIIRTNSRNSKKNSTSVVNVKSVDKKETSSEFADTINIGQRKVTPVERDLATNKRLQFEHKLSQNLGLNNEAEESSDLTHTALISSTERVRINYPDVAFSEKTLNPPPAFIDNLFLSKNSSISKIQPGQNSSRIVWTYTPFLSYEWAQYRIDSDLPAINSIKQGNEHEPSFSTGVLVTGQFEETWMLQSGIVYSNTTIDIAPQKIYAVQSPNGDYAYKYITSAGYGYIRPGFLAAPALGDSLSTAEAEHTLRHITIPLVIKYKIGRGKFSLLPGAGIAANFLTGTKVETEIKNATNKETIIITKLTGTKNLNWSLTADAEMQYQLNNKTSINLRPGFRYAISSITKNDDFQTFPYAFGIGLGMTFKF